MTTSNNQERAQRILDTATDLIVHYGYDKTTVSDIAQQAGISKGAVYLHFKSKDELLEALIIRETQAYAEKWLDGIEADPRGGTIGGMYKAMLVALSSSPFLSAMFRQDGRILGSYLRNPGSVFRDQRFKGTRQEFVKMMQEAGAIRPDVDAKVTAHIMNMLAFGLVGLDDIVDSQERPSTDEIIAGIADVMDRALTPNDGGNSEGGKTIVRQLVENSLQKLKTT
jgi:TetR/AcrR family acrAB operon transcriptional repressor